MLRRSLFALALLSAALPATSASAESSTIRIEPRPYYGAVVTLEQGVRVWRPLPPTRHMIINPTGSPISVNVTDVRETINHQGYAGGGAQANAHASAGGSHGVAPYYYARALAHRGHGVHRPHHGPRAHGLRR